MSTFNETVLEEMIDKQGMTYVLNLLERICYNKAAITARNSTTQEFTEDWETTANILAHIKLPNGI